MEGHKPSPSVAIYSILVNILREIGSLEVAKELLHTLEAKQLQPNVIQLVTPINAFCR